MSRYGGTGPSRATASTQCQKCLQRGHYSYECKVALQDRPYTSRPSRTQQLANPDLRPQLTSGPAPTLQLDGLADKILEEQRSKRQRLDEDGRSVARSSSPDSIATISTNARSASPPPPKKIEASKSRRSRSPGRERHHHRHRSRSPSRERHHHRHRSHRHHQRRSSKRRDGDEDRERRHKHRHGHGHSHRRSRRHESDAEDDGGGKSGKHRRNERSRSRSRSPRRERRRSASPGLDEPVRARSPLRRSPSPFTQRRMMSQGREPQQRPRSPPRSQREARRPPADQPARPRSLSPFSKRRALTRAMNS